MKPLPPGTQAAEPSLLDQLHSCANQGWLRRLDSALAAFMLEQDPQAAPALLVSSAMLAQMEGRGHTCLALRSIVTQPQELLAWPDLAQPALSRLWQHLPAELAGWLAGLRASPLVRCVGQQGLAGQTDAPDAGQPLVLGGSQAEPLLYLRRYWRYEAEVASAVLQRVTSSQSLDQALARHWLDRLFEPRLEPRLEPADKSLPDTLRPVAEEALVDWQKFACALALRAGLTVITGGPGTGKTYTAARLLALLFALHDQPAGLRVALAAPTGKAAARLRQTIDASLQELGARLGSSLDLTAFAQRMGAAKTLHALLGARPDTRQFRFHAGNLLDIDIVIVDEASMIHLEMMAALLRALPAGAKLILLGDKDQLASVEAGAVLGELCRDAWAGHYDLGTARFAQLVAAQTLPPALMAQDALATPLAQQTVMLRTSRRFGNLIGQLALAVNTGEAQAALNLIANDQSQVLQLAEQPSLGSLLGLALKGRPGTPAGYAEYLALVQDRPAGSRTDALQHAAWVKGALQSFEQFRILCAVHDSELGTKSLNQAVQTALAQAGLVSPRGEWYAGRPVMVTRNDPELGVFNGDVGLALPGLGPQAALRVYFLDGEQLRSVSVGRLAHVETAFAMSVHKCQGSEFLHTVLVLPQWGEKLLTRSLVYTGITRARQFFTLVQAQAGLLEQAIARPSRRASGLRARLGC